MTPAELFLSADAALRSVIDRLEPQHLTVRAPLEWTTQADPTIRDIVFAHAYDEAWIPDVLAGKALADGDPHRDADLLGDDAVAGYDLVNDAATAAVRAGVVDDAVFRFQYGDYSAAEGFAHLATYRAFQAWLIAKHLGLPFRMSDELIDGLEEHVEPHIEEWRQFGVFPPALPVPEGADRESRLLHLTGYFIE